MSNQHSQQKVRAYYDAAVDLEWSRADRHRTEFAVSLRAITGHLAGMSPRPGRTRLRILDDGGGPGRYSLALSQAGHDVTLLDLSPANVEFCRRMTGGRLDGYHAGTATDLGRLPDASFDAVLLMGPLYHLLDEGDRRQAVAEACRVLAPGGLLFCSFITVWAPIRDWAKSHPEGITARCPTPGDIFAWAADGRLPIDEGFTDAYVIHPSAVVPFLEAAGPLETVELLGVEGAISMIEERVNELTGPLWDYWVEVNFRLARDPTLHGASEHLLHIGRRKK